MSKGFDVYDVRRRNLRRLADALGGPAKLADKLGRSESQISQLIGKTSTRNIGDRLARDVEKISKLREGSLDFPSELMVQDKGGTYGIVETGPEVMLKEVAVVGTTQAGPDVAWEELGYPPGYGADYLDAPSKDPRAYALRVKGASMAPRMREGEVILVEPSLQAQPGDEVVVKTRRGDVMVKTLISIRNEEVTLDSISPDFDRIVLPASDCLFMHVVAGVFRASSVRKRKPGR